MNATFFVLCNFVSITILDDVGIVVCFRDTTYNAFGIGITRFLLDIDSYLWWICWRSFLV